MPKQYLMLFTAAAVMVGHVGLLPFIFLYVDRPPLSERIDIAMLIGPLTAAYFVSVVRYAIDNAAMDFSTNTTKVNTLYVLTSVFVVLPFIGAIYYLLVIYQEDQQDFAFVKNGIGVIELFLGAAFTMYIDSLFGSPAKQ
jgi:hypothetical protein